MWKKVSSVVVLAVVASIASGCMLPPTDPSPLPLPARNTR
jgi:hypothetical protein